MLGGEIAELALEGLQQVGPVAGLVGAPVVQLGGAVRAEVALHCLLVGLRRGEAGRREILQCSCSTLPLWFFRWGSYTVTLGSLCR